MIRPRTAARVTLLSLGGAGLGVGLGAAGLVAGLTGLVLGGSAFVRTRKATSTT